MSPGKIKCPECGKTAKTPQALGSHRYCVHRVPGVERRTGRKGPSGKTRAGLVALRRMRAQKKAGGYERWCLEGLAHQWLQVAITDDGDYHLVVGKGGF